MSSRLDEQIRELFAELDEVAPGPPPMPRAPVSETRPPWTRGIAYASGVAVVVLVIGVAGQLLRTGSDETGVLEEAPATTQAFAEAAETVAGAAEPRPVDRALALATLNLACSTFTSESALAVPSVPGSPQEHVDAGAALQPPLSVLVSAILSVERDLDDPDFAPVVQLSEQLEANLSDLASGNVEDPASAYRQFELDVFQLGTGLTDYGALDCVDLT